MDGQAQPAPAYDAMDDNPQAQPPPPQAPLQFVFHEHQLQILVEGLAAQFANIAMQNAPAPPAPVEKPPVLQGANTLTEQHAKLGELLLQALLRLDAINIESGWPEARAERKRVKKAAQRARRTTCVLGGGNDRLSNDVD